MRAIGYELVYDHHTYLTVTPACAYRAALPNHAIAILAYGAKHGYSKVYAEAAPHTLTVDPVEAFRHLGHVWFVHWVR